MAQHKILILFKLNSHAKMALLTLALLGDRHLGRSATLDHAAAGAREDLGIRANSLRV